MNNARHKSVVDLHLLLIREGQVLLGRRQNTGFEDGKFHLPAGHLEEDENVVQAVIREAKEELGISIRSDALELVLIMHQNSGASRVGMFFAASKWDGIVRNMEPSKCSELGWFDLRGLPDLMVPYAKAALERYLQGERLVLHGWEGDAISA